MEMGKRGDCVLGYSATPTYISLWMEWRQVTVETYMERYAITNISTIIILNFSRTPLGQINSVLNKVYSVLNKVYSVWFYTNVAIGTVESVLN